MGWIALLSALVILGAGTSMRTFSADPWHGAPTRSMETDLHAYEIRYVNVIMGGEYEFFNLDFIEPDEILVRTWDEMVILSALNGTTLEVIECAPGNGQPHGLAYVDSCIHVNDEYDTCMYRSTSSGWTTYLNPAGDDGRGMDFDGECLWELTETGGQLLRFDTTGVLQQSWTLPADAYMTGMTLFPSGDGQGIAILCREGNWPSQDDYLTLFEMDGSTLTPLGSADLPDKLASYGLTFSETRGTFFWAYMQATPETPYYAIMEFELLPNSLEGRTWGAIKAGFQYPL